MDRRRFLELTGAVAAAALSGCGGGGGSSSTPAVTSTGPDWTGLAAGMQGNLVLPGSATYTQAALVFNRRFDSVLPRAIAYCASVTDVQEVLAFVKKNNLTLTPRCGGHSFGGYSKGTGVVLDVGPMNTVHVNSNGTAKIGAGAKLADVYDQLIAQGVSIPSATCLTVGISGVTMGGGVSILDRKYGLTCDNLLSAEVVTADGQLRVCDATHEPDLFWALRGGGGGNFGVATSFTFKTHPIQPLSTYTAVFDYADLATVFQAWQALPQTWPDELWGQIVINFWDAASPPTFYVWAVGVGTVANLHASWDQFITDTLATPTSNVANDAPYRDVIMGFCTGLSQSQCHFVGQTPDATVTGLPFASTSDFYDNPLPLQGIQALQHGIQTAQSAGITGQIILDLMGGAISTVAPTDTAFVHRNAIFSAEYFMDSTGIANPTWSNNMRTVMAPWTSGEAYVNYIDPLIKNWQAAYYGANYARLQHVKTEYDPNRLFNFAQGIVPG